MTATLEASVRELLDRAAICEVVLRYARAVDRHDLEAVADCFTADASYKGSLGEGGIEVALKALRDRIGQYSGTMHFIGNQLVQLDGDCANAETYAIAYHQIAGEEERRSMAVAVRYLDSLVRTPAGWRIRRREVALEWQRYDELVLPVGA